MLDLRGYTNMAPVYVSYQESSCLVYAWKVDTMTDLIRDGHKQFVCVLGLLVGVLVDWWLTVSDSVTTVLQR